MHLALTALTAENRIGATHRAVLVLDGAGWHTSGTLDIPEGIDPVVLPPSSPEVQPVERVWSLVDEPVANRPFADLDELEAVLVARCRTLRADRRTIKAHTRFHWWPRGHHPRNTS
jgi:hypothetical protein